MNPEAEDAYRIADKHLIGATVELRKALALDILEAIMRHSGVLAAYAIRTALNNARRVDD